MLRIPCPHCGLRDLAEFRYGGEAGVVRPAEPAACSDEEWANYLYFRNNHKGLQQERWVHIHGCRQWFELRRDNLTHDVAHDLTQPQGESPEPPA
ncbi:MAG TPA: sarcosine oxidase subunit delta [Xanthomonadales bacterium]|nr:sarcosine oxidase subunit delta [Xanthomonadales bacterium]